MPALNSDDKRYLLDVARHAIAEKLQVIYPTPKDVDSKSLRQKNGVFVTLHENGDLRGCIGCFESEDCLPKTVATYALAAAFDDTRFPPISKSEFKDITIEISVLGAPKKTDDITRHFKEKPGVIIRKGYRQATFLPQVWDDLQEPDEFMEHLCVKAGLQADEWTREGMNFSVYTVDSFEENKD
jgi:AmmeMemoRadiSam system protein A